MQETTSNRKARRGKRSAHPHEEALMTVVKSGTAATISGRVSRRVDSAHRSKNNAPANPAKVAEEPPAVREGFDILFRLARALTSG